MMFLASNSLQNLGGQKLSCTCYHARHLQQIHWNKLLFWMYGRPWLGLFQHRTFVKYWWDCTNYIRAWNCFSLIWFAELAIPFCIWYRIPKSTKNRLSNFGSIESCNFFSRNKLDLWQIKVWNIYFSWISSFFLY